MCKNEFTEFPENGYADEIGTVPGNIRYKCASSAVWTDENTLSVQVQIIDKYMGVLHMKFRFFDNKVGIYMTKTAEDFLGTYNGYATGTHK